MELARAKAVSWFSWLSRGAVLGGLLTSDDLNGLKTTNKVTKEIEQIHVSAYIYRLFHDVAGCCRILPAEVSFEKFFITGIVSFQTSYASNVPSINQVQLFCLHTFHTLAMFNYIFFDVCK